MTCSATESSSRSRTSRRPAQRVGHRARRRLEHVGPAAQLGHAHEQLGVAGGEVELAHLALEADEVLGRELLQQALAVLLVDPEAAQQRGIERGVAEADPIALQADGVQRVAQHGQRLGRPRGPGGADELDAGLQELAHLAAVRRDLPVGVGDVAEAQRRLGRLVARGHDARDRHGHVRAQGQHVAVVVDHAVGRLHAAVAAAQDGLVLDRRRVDLAVAVALEDAAQGVGDRAQLPHLVGEHVAGAARDAVDHTGAGSVATRSIWAPSSRRRSSMRS